MKKLPIKLKKLPEQEFSRNEKHIVVNISLNKVQKRREKMRKLSRKRLLYLKVQ